MPILANAKKALRVSERKAVVNKKVKTSAKTKVDAFKKAPNVENLNQAFSAVDKAVKRNIFHKNRAARIKANLTKLLNASK